MNHDDPIKIYGYARASSPKDLGTGKQKYSKQEASPIRQAELIEKTARRIAEDENSGLVWARCLMEWKSAVKFSFKERPVFKELMDLLEPGDHLVVWRLDRLGRNIFSAGECLGWLAERNIIVHTVEELKGMPLRFDTALGRAVSSVLLLAADISAELTRHATQDALDWCKRNGLAYGKLQVGMRRVPVTLHGKTYLMDVFDEDDMRTMAEVDSRMKAGESMASIGEDLDRRGVRDHTGKQWHPKRRKTKLDGTKYRTGGYRNGDRLKRGLATYQRYLEQFSPEHQANHANAKEVAEAILRRIPGLATSS